MVTTIGCSEEEKVLDLLDSSEKVFFDPLVLHYACYYKNYEVIKFLLSKDKSPYAIDDQGYSPLHYLTNMGDLGKNKEMMKLSLYSDPTDLFVKKEALKIRLFDGLFRSSDNILRNILVAEGGSLLSIDEGDIYGKREKIFNKNDWLKDNCSQGEFKEVLDDLLSNEEKKLKVVKEQMKQYDFSNDIYETFEKRFTNYRDIVIQEVF